MFGSALQRRAYSSSSADDLLQYELQYGRGEDKHQWHTYPRPAPPETSHPPRITYMKRNSAESGKRGGTHRLDGGRTAGVESRAAGVIANDVPAAAGGRGRGVAAGVSSSLASPSGRLLHSNLDCFLDVTTPKVKPQTLRKVKMLPILCVVFLDCQFVVCSSLGCNGWYRHTERRREYLI
jgi:hypothetical protein